MLMNAIMFLCAVLDIQILYTYFRGMFHQKKELILLFMARKMNHNTVRKQYFDNLGINISL